MLDDALRGISNKVSWIS